MRGVIYARFSSHAQKEESIEQQVEECRAFARQQGIDITEVYADKAISGKTDNRSDFQRMLRDAQKHKFEAVIAYKSNRISRNMLNALQYEARLEKLGITTLYAKEEFGDTAAGRFALRTMMNVNQFYSENLAEDIKRGMMDNALQCKVNGSLPYGYRRGEDGHFEVIPAEAEIVRNIYDQFIHGIPFSEMSAELNGRGLRTRRGLLWNKSSYYPILKNEAYIGVYRYSTVRIENGVPPIISRSVYETAQMLLKQRKTHRKGESYLLSGKLYCGRCNAPMTGVSATGEMGKVYYYYCCRNHRHGQCGMPVVGKDDIENKVADIVRERILVPEFIEQLADALMEYQASLNINSERDLFRSQLSEVKGQVSNILKAIERGIYTDSVANRLLELETRQKQLEEQVASLEDIPVYDRKHIIFALTKFAKDAEASQNYKKVIIDTFVKEVWIYDDHMRFDFFYGNGIEFHLPSGNSAPPTSIRTNFFLFWDCFSVLIQKKTAGD